MLSVGSKNGRIPGLAVVIVKDGKVVVMKGYGNKEVGKKDPVDENTLFMIASNSKLFTGTALANLEAEKKLSLDDKITKYFPDFRVYDEAVTRMVTIRDLLSHRIGTKTFQGDFTFWSSALSRQEIIRRMRLLKPVGIFRQDYGYCNSCFLTAGEVIPVVTGKSWEEYISGNILEPLGMTNTFALTKDFSKRKNIALPYTNTFGPLAQVPFDQIDNFAPAASIVSNVKDLSKWLMLQLDSGRYNGNTIIPWPAIRATRDINIVTNSRKSSVYPTHIRGYGLGVFVQDYNGVAVYYHTGGADGYVTNTCFIPEKNLGISILTNNDNQNFFEALRYQVMDAYLGVPYTDRSAFYLKFHQKDSEALQDSLKVYRSKLGRSSIPDGALKKLKGMYTNPVYGKIEILEYNRNGYTVKFENHPNLSAHLEYMDGDKFLLTYSHPGYGVFPATIAVESGKVKSVEIKVNDFLESDPYLFTKD